jgi:heme/copper-type cytochrome/quinol oxidase subunit 2
MSRAAAASGRDRPRAARVLGAAVAVAVFALAPPAVARAAAGDPDVELTASAAGFRPKVVRLRKGEAVRLRLRTSDREQCFAVDELRVEKRILPGRDTLLELTPDRVGTFAFYSCLEPDNQALRGRLIVSE